jgi:predicted nucleotidyltransferase
VFGSTATGSARAHSDVDVAVYLREPRPPASAFGYDGDLASSLMRDLGTSRVDVVVLNDAARRNSTQSGALVAPGYCSW